MSEMYFEFGRSDAAGSPDAAAARAAKNRSNRDLGMRLLDISRTGSRADLERVLGTGISPHFHDPTRGTALHQASLQTEVDLIAGLLRFQPNPTEFTPRAAARSLPSPLHLAIWNNRAEAVELLKRVTAFAAPDRDGLLPTHIAALRNDEQVLESLLAEGYDAQAIDARGCSPLFYASSRGNDRAVASLLSRMSEPSTGAAYVDSSGRNPIMYLTECFDKPGTCAWLPCPATAYWLPEWNENGLSAAAAVPEETQEARCHAVFQALRDAGCSANSLDVLGRSARQYALQCLNGCVFEDIGVGDMAQQVTEAEVSELLNLLLTRLAAPGWRNVAHLLQHARRIGVVLVRAADGRVRWPVLPAMSEYMTAASPIGRGGCSHSDALALTQQLKEELRCEGSWARKIHGVAWWLHHNKPRPRQLFVV